MGGKLIQNPQRHGELEMVQLHFIIISTIKLQVLQNMIPFVVIRSEKEILVVKRLLILWKMKIDQDIKILDGILTL